MLKFSTRQAARSFAQKSGHKTVDLLASTKEMVEVFKISAGINKRWAVKVL